MIRYCKTCRVHLCDTCRSSYTDRIVAAFKATFAAALGGKRQDSPDRCYICRKSEAQLNQRGENAG